MKEGSLLIQCILCIRVHFWWPVSAHDCPHTVNLFSWLNVRVHRYFLSLWYTRDEYGKRASHFMGWATISGASSGLIAYGISMIPTNRLNTWQWYGTFIFTQVDINHSLYV